MGIRSISYRVPCVRVPHFCSKPHSECMRATYRTHTRGHVTAECGARGPEVYVEHASAGLGRARVRTSQ
eukprot:3555820-Prymnesium_polylepis.1